MPAPDALPEPEPVPWHASELTWPLTTAVGPGLSGAVAAATTVAWHNPDTGRVGYRQLSMGRLSGMRFDEVAWLLASGTLPEDDAAGLEDFRTRLVAARELTPAAVGVLDGMPSDVEPLDTVRAGLSALGCPYGSVASPDVTMSAVMLGQLCGLVEAVARRRRHAAPAGVDSDSMFSLPDDADVAHALSSAIIGRQDPELEALISTALVLVADDGLSPSTFSALVVGSCLGDAWAALMACLSGFGGELRLPAPLDADQRLDMLQDRLESLAGDDGRPTLATALKRLKVTTSTPSVPALAGAALVVAGVPAALVPAVLAVGRAAGVLARLGEYTADPRLFRPLANYTGPSARPFQRPADPA